MQLSPLPIHLSLLNTKCQIRYTMSLNHHVSRCICNDSICALNEPLQMTLYNKQSWGNNVEIEAKKKEKEMLLTWVEQVTSRF